MQTIGFLGLGVMGENMAKNIQKAGYPMVVFDVRKEQEQALVSKGARSAKTPAELASMCDIIFTSLPGPVEVEKVALGPNGLGEGIRSGSIYVDLSTSRASLIQKIAAEFSKKGVKVCDAPVSGGLQGAISGNLAIIFGGDKEVFEQITPVLKSFGNKLLYCGKTGSGCICKLAHNLVSIVTQQTLAEAFTMAIKAGAEPTAVFDAIRKGGVGRMGILHDHLPATLFLDKMEPARFALALATKDLKLATETARENNVPMPISTIVEQLMVEAMNRGWGKLDYTCYLKIQEEASGAKIRASGIDLAAASKLVIFNPEFNK